MVLFPEDATVSLKWCEIELANISEKFRRLMNTSNWEMTSVYLLNDNNTPLYILAYEIRGIEKPPRYILKIQFNKTNTKECQR